MADASSVSRAASSLRDTILSALTSGGNADFFSLPGGLTLRVEADATDPLIVNVGGREYTFQADIDVTLTNTAHNFVFLDIDGTGSVETIPPIYSFSAPGAPASGQYWYDLGKRQMKRYDGAAFQNVNRIYLGYARADGGSINARYACDVIGLDPYTRFSKFGDGSDGFLNVTAGTTTIDGLKKYTAVVITGSATLNHTDNTSRVLAVYAQTVVINLSSNGIILNGLGKNGGSGGTTTGTAGSGTGHGGSGGGGGGGTNGGGAGSSFLGTSGSNNFSAGTAGTAGNPGGNGTATTFSDFPRAPMIFLNGNGGGQGGGDGTGGGAGGDGGGSIAIVAPTIANASGGSITANGNNGTAGSAANRGGGGGGGGGIIILIFRNHFNSGTESASGGTGGSAGGAGAGAGGTGGAGVVLTERV